MSSASVVKINAVECPRFSGEGLTPQSKSGPKARTKVVVDGQLVHIPVLPIIRTAGTQEDRESQEWYPGPSTKSHLSGKSGRRG